MSIFYLPVMDDKILPITNVVIKKLVLEYICCISVFKYIDASYKTPIMNNYFRACIDIKSKLGLKDKLLCSSCSTIFQLSVS